MTALVAILLLYSLVREAYFIYSTQKLMNKLMSRNYQDFQMSEKSGKINPKPVRLPVPDDEPEDFSPLNDIM